MKIAICDDEKRESNDVVSLLRKYSLQMKTPFIVDTYRSGFSLLESIDSGRTYDIIILDILMPCMTGIETARQIRESDKIVKIIFLTSSSEFAVESYSVDAFYYLLKPLVEKNFFLILNKVLQSIKHEEEASIIITDGKIVRRILLFELVYCEILRRTICYHMEDGNIIQSTGTLAELEKDMLRYDFIAKPHRSFLVNLRHVTEVTIKELKTDIGISIPLARGRYDEICHAFLAQAFEEGMA